MKFIKQIFCKHEYEELIMDVYGDKINYLNCRSIWECQKCGRQRKSDWLSCGWINHLIKGKKVDSKKISDGYHTFDELYYHRMILFSVICNQNKEKAWKSWLHDDGTMFDDYFIIGVETEDGNFTYHYHNDFWDYFKVKELARAPKWDGHTSNDILRLNNINTERWHND